MRLLWRILTNLDSVLKSKDITLLTKVHIVKAIVFPVVMYGCESWTIKKVECQTIDAFEVWCWRRLLRVPWTARRLNQSMSIPMNTHWKYWCWSWSSNTLGTWCEKLTHWKRPWCWQVLKAGGEGGGKEKGRGWVGYIASLTQWTWVWANSMRQWRTGQPGVPQSLGSQRVRLGLVIEQQQIQCDCLYKKRKSGHTDTPKVHLNDNRPCESFLTGRRWGESRYLQTMGKGFRRNQPLQYLDLGLLASRTARQYISVV